MLATGGERVSGVATHAYRDHFMPWACTASCELSGGGMVRGASYKATASASSLAGERGNGNGLRRRAYATGASPRELQPSGVQKPFSVHHA
jgi:hypothetical protein